MRLWNTKVMYHNRNACLEYASYHVHFVLICHLRWWISSSRIKEGWWRLRFCRLKSWLRKYVLRIRVSSVCQIQKNCTTQSQYTSHWYLTTSISFWFVRCGKSVGSRVGCDCESVRSNKLSKYKYKLIHQYLTTSISLWSVSMHHLTLFLNQDNALRWRGRADLIAGILFVDCCWYCTLESLPQPQSLWPLQQLEVLHCKDSDTSWKDSK